MAQAEQPEPVALTETNPLSSASQPAQSTTPFVKGRGDGAIASVVQTRAVGGLPITADVNPANGVTIYTDPTCTGVPLETSTVEQLEGAGIQVEVAPDTSTTFYATQTEAGEPIPSDCSKPLTYWHSSTPVTPPSEPPGGGTPGGGTTAPGGSARPDAPHLRTVPGGRANDNTPLVTGTAPGAATVKVFTTAGCKGTPVAKGSAGEFASGLEVQVADNTTTSFYGVSVAGGNQSNCSTTPAVYTEDSTPPHTRITMAPGVKTRNRSPVFRFTDTTDDPPGTNFLCKVDRARWKLCSTPLHLRRLRLRSHVVRVKAVDTAGNQETVGTKRRFKVIRRP